MTRIAWSRRPGPRQLAVYQIQVISESSLSWLSLHSVKSHLFKWPFQEICFFAVQALAQICQWVQSSHWQQAFWGRTACGPVSESVNLPSLFVRALHPSQSSSSVCTVSWSWNWLNLKSHQLETWVWEDKVSRLCSARRKWTTLCT